MAEFDALSTQPRHSTALLVAFRPWVFSLVAARQRTKRRIGRVPSMHRLQKPLQLVLRDPLAQGSSHFHGVPEMRTGVDA
jgi:hypothetical protein